MPPQWTSDQSMVIKMDIKNKNFKIHSTI